MKKTVASFDPDGLLGLKEMELLSELQESDFGFYHHDLENPMVGGPAQ